MEYMEGGNLRDFIEKQHPKGVPLKRAVELATDIMMGILYMHAQNIMHRDIKPENTLLTQTRRLAAKITGNHELFYIWHIPNKLLLHTKILALHALQMQLSPSKWAPHYVRPPFHSCPSR